MDSDALRISMAEVPVTAQVANESGRLAPIPVTVCGSSVNPGLIEVVFGETILVFGAAELRSAVLAAFVVAA